MSAYNVEKYVADAIESILNQTFKDFEFIILDDGSTDTTCAIAKSFQIEDERIVLIKNERNIGLTKSLNKGLSIARGKYIARMDADDIALPTRLSVQVNYLENNPGVFLIGAAANIVDQSAVVVDVNVPPTNPEHLLKKRNCILHPTIMFQNLSHIYYREKLLYCEDYDLYLRLLSEKMKLRNLPDILLNYRVHDDSISRSKVTTQYLFSKKALEFYLERLKFGSDSYEALDISEVIQSPLTPDVLYYQLQSSLYTNNYVQLRKQCIAYLQKFGLNTPVLLHLLLSLLPKKLIRALKNIKRFKRRIVPTINFKSGVRS
jgi:glycosyltransferase involved in cell wall biosynthesis